MAKTAEEILKESGVYPSDFISSSGYLGTVHAIQSHAAQEVKIATNRTVDAAIAIMKSHINGKPFDAINELEKLRR